MTDEAHLKIVFLPFFYLQKLIITVNSKNNGKDGDKVKSLGLRKFSSKLK